MVNKNKEDIINEHSRLKDKLTLFLKEQCFELSDLSTDTSLMYIAKENNDKLFLTIDGNSIEFGFNNFYWWFDLENFTDMLKLALTIKELKKA